MVQQISGTILKIVNLTVDIRHFVLQLDEGMDFKPGQFVIFGFQKDGVHYQRPYSIASSPEGENTILDLCIKLIPHGKVTPRIFELEVGDQFSLKGPFGFMTPKDTSNDNLVFIGTGTGVVPFRSIIKYLLYRNTKKNLTLIHGSRHEKDKLYREEFEELEKSHPNFCYVKTLSRPHDLWSGRCGYVQENLDCVDVLNSEIYICGIKDMVDDTIKKLVEKGVGLENIHYEKY